MDQLNLGEGSSRGDTKGKAPEQMEAMVDEDIWYNVWQWHNILHLDFNEHDKQISSERIKTNKEIYDAKKKKRRGEISKEAAKEIREEGKLRLLELDNEEKGVEQNRRYLEEIKTIYLIMADKGYKITKVNLSPMSATQEMIGPFSIDGNTKGKLDQIGVRIKEDETGGRTTISFDLERRSLRRLKTKWVEIAGIILDKKTLV